MRPHDIDLVAQLKKNAQRTRFAPPQTKGFVRYAFPWSATFALNPRQPDRMLNFVCSHPISEALKRCPIYRALPREGRRELVLRGPKSFLRYRRELWGILYGTVDAYLRFAPGGVSPVTALALLVPEPRYEVYADGLSGRLVVPAPLVYVDPKTKLAVKRHTSEWQVVAWAMKRYVAVSWAAMTGPGADIRRSATSLRQTIRRNVEEPLAGFYRHLTGQELDPTLYSSALGDEPKSPAWSRERMRALKRAASKATFRNPARNATPVL